MSHTHIHSPLNTAIASLHPLPRPPKTPQPQSARCTPNNQPPHTHPLLCVCTGRRDDDAPRPPTLCTRGNGGVGAYPAGINIRETARALARSLPPPPRDVRGGAPPPRPTTTTTTRGRRALYRRDKRDLEYRDTRGTRKTGRWRLSLYIPPPPRRVRLYVCAHAVRAWRPFCNLSRSRRGKRGGGGKGALLHTYFMTYFQKFHFRIFHLNAAAATALSLTLCMLILACKPARGYYPVSKALLERGRGIVRRARLSISI